MLTVQENDAILIPVASSEHCGSDLRRATEFFLTGSMAKVITLSAVILILMLRPQGLFAAKLRK